MKLEHQEWNRPEDVTAPQFVGHVALEESPSDLAGQVVAALVSSALALLEYDITERSQSTSLVRMLSSRSSPCSSRHPQLLRTAIVMSWGFQDDAPCSESVVLSTVQRFTILCACSCVLAGICGNELGGYVQVNRAHRLFQSALFSPGLYTEAMFDNSTITSASGHVSENTGIEDYYPSFAFGDDLFWASTWLYRAATNNIRRFNISYYNEAMEVTLRLACVAHCPVVTKHLAVRVACFGGTHEPAELCRQMHLTCLCF